MLSIAELADVFQLSHLVRDAPAPPDEVDQDVADMMELENQLGSLAGESALSSTAGGILTRFFAYDVISFFITAYLAYNHLSTVHLDGNVSASPIATNPSTSLHSVLAVMAPNKAGHTMAGRPEFRVSDGCAPGC